MKRAIALGAGLLTSNALGTGWAIARRLTAPAGPRIFDLAIRDIEHDHGTRRVVLDRTTQTIPDGIYNLWIERGGWVQLSAEASNRGPHRIARTVVGTGRSTLGHTETADVDEAIGYAVRRGAQRIILFGWSMGAAIALQLAARPRHHGLIGALVFDSPVLDWTETIKANCARSGLPAAAGHLAVPWLSAGRLASIVGLPEPVPLRQFDWIARAAQLTTPTLILHGTRDNSAPIRLSQALRDRGPDIVTLETFGADHTLAWNSDPERWRSAVIAWLRGQPSG